jgi:hypothetical protein
MNRDRFAISGSGGRVSFVIGLTAVAFSLFITACGGSSSSGPSAQEMARLKQLGASHVHKEDRLRKLEAELKHITHTGPTASVESPGSGASPSPEGGSTVKMLESCGGELSVNADTSCPFAENVKGAYFEEVGSGAGTVEAYSPVTGDDYAMTCSDSPHECVGGNDAAVYFP